MALGVEPLESRGAQLSRLEAERAQRASNEKRLQDLVARLRQKVLQYEGQNSENAKASDDELARLSSELQRTLHAQHGMEARIADLDERALALEKITRELQAEGSATAGALQARKEALELAAHQRENGRRWLKEEEHAVQRCRAEGSDAFQMHAQLEAQLEKLRPRMERHGMRERASVALQRMAMQREMMRAFQRFRKAFMLRRAERLKLEKLQSALEARRREQAIGVWKKCWVRVSFLRQARSDQGSAALSSAYDLWVRRVEEGRWMHKKEAAADKQKQHWTKRNGFTALIAASIASLGLRLRQSDRHFISSMLYRWLRSAELARFFRQGEIKASHRRSKSLSRCILQHFASACRGALRRRRLIAQQQLKSRRIAQQQTMECFRRLMSLCHLVNSSLNFSAKSTLTRVCRMAIAIFKRLLFRRRHLNAISGDMIKVQQQRVRKFLLPSAFNALKMFVSHSQKTCLIMQEKQKKHALTVVVAIIPQWLRVARRHRMIIQAADKTSDMRRRIGLHRWRNWCLARSRERVVRKVLRRRVPKMRDASFKAWVGVVHEIRWPARRSCTIASRRRLVLMRWALRLWCAAIRRILKDSREALCGLLDGAEEQAEDGKAGCIKAAEARNKAESALKDLADEIERKCGVADSMRAKCEAMKAEGMTLVGQLQSLRCGAESLRLEVTQLMAQDQQKEAERASSLQALEGQLLDALEVQTSLRITHRNLRSEVDILGDAKARAERRASELQLQLEGSRSAYVEAVGLRDLKVSGLEQKCRAAQISAKELEKALEHKNFRTRVCELELQRYRYGRG